MTKPRKPLVVVSIRVPAATRRAVLRDSKGARAALVAWAAGV